MIPLRNSSVSMVTGDADRRMSEGHGKCVLPVTLFALSKIRRVCKQQAYPYVPSSLTLTEFDQPEY